MDMVDRNAACRPRQRSHDVTRGQRLHQRFESNAPARAHDQDGGHIVASAIFGEKLVFICLSSEADNRVSCHSGGPAKAMTRSPLTLTIRHSPMGASNNTRIQPFLP
jgi:hypothetical protein